MADTQKRENQNIPGYTPETLNAKAELTTAGQPIATWRLGELHVDAHRARDALWIVVRRPGEGGVALRTFPVMGEFTLTPLDVRGDGGAWQVDTHSGVHRIDLRLDGDRLLRMTSRLTPSENLLVSFWPRDLYPVDSNLDPCGSRGRVEAAQRGLNGGYCYFCLDEPKFANVLYVQNLGALNPYFQATDSKPDGVVGGLWPELGYLPPAAPMGFSPPDHPLTKGETYVISDVALAIRPDCAANEFESARVFIDMLADIYPHLSKSEPALHDWLWRARATLEDLKTAPEATVEAYGHRYLHPYTASEYPDSMVQMSVLSTLCEYEHAFGLSDQFTADLKAGMRKFYDDDLKVLRRYLPNVGNDKDADAVDSWYLYHPLMNLARLAIDGQAWAKDLFFDSLEFVIGAARHFSYVWPIIYNVRDLSVIQQARDEQGLGQTDVGGLYAYVMLQAHQLTGDRRYVDEAKAALKALEDFRFELSYQTNLTAWGAVACLKMWQLENDPRYLDQSFVFVASFLHNCELWQSEIKFAAAYANFFGVTCLHDGPYMAAYEAFECFMAFDEYLRLGADDLPDSVRLLLSEYWRYALDVLWGFYPDTLPPEALAKQVRNGHIDPNLSFPLEDLYGDGSRAGQVGQEIYGAGSAFVVASRAWSDCQGQPFRVFSEYPAKIDCQNGQMSLRLLGSDQKVRVCLQMKDEASQPDVVLLHGENGEIIAPDLVRGDIREYRVAGNGSFVVMWQPAMETAV